MKVQIFFYVFNARHILVPSRHNFWIKVFSYTGTLHKKDTASNYLLPAITLPKNITHN